MPKTKPKPAVPRHPSDPRVAEILSVFDRVAASPHNGEEGDGLVHAAVSLIVTTGEMADLFHGRGWEWPVRELRELLLEFALSAPAPVLAQMVREARRQRSWIEWWDRRGRDECELIPDAHELLLPWPPQSADAWRP